MATQCPKCKAENPDSVKFCGECGTQLKPAHAETRTLRTPTEDSTIGEIVSEKYKLLEEIGSGGMGVVYKAEQIEPIKRSIAIKIIKLGMDTKEVVARFETERQSLAVMDHPNIAKVYDAGSTERGRPFFAMELVRGIPITDYCDKHNLTACERLELFIPLCQAVQHAHQKGVIHRDLKPSNVLVAIHEDKPIPKIIDFGIAKAIEHRLTEKTLFTEQGQLIGTPSYMSPEQAEMSGLDVDTRADIYSLGVMLYELLVGVLPFDPKTFREAGFSEIQRIIREEEPPRASTRLSGLGDTQISIAKQRSTDVTSLHKQLKGDLDWITMKAMEKDRTRRYSSPEELAEDIRRYLRYEPIKASPPSQLYRMRKFIRRHKWGVTAALVFVGLLMAVAALMTVQSVRIANERDRAEKEVAKSKAITDFLLETFNSANPIDGSGLNITVLEALKIATDKINDAFEEQPEVEAEVKQTIGLTYLRLGQYEEAEELLRSSVKMLQDLRGHEHPDLATPLTTLGLLRYERGDYEEAETLYRQALQINRRKYGGDENEDVTPILNNIALLLSDKGDFDAAEPIFRKILEIDRKIFGNDHLDVAFDLNNLGRLLKDKKSYVESEALLQESIDILRKEQHPALSIVLGNMGDLLAKKGDYKAAAPIFDEAISIGQTKLGEKNQNLPMLRSKYGWCLTNLNQFEKAEEQLLAALPDLKKSLGEHHNITQKTISFIIDLYTAWGKEAKAAEYQAQLSLKEK